MTIKLIKPYIKGGRTGIPWFLDPSSYKIYDDFTSYALGTFSSNDKWTVSGGTNVAIDSSSYSESGRHLVASHNSTVNIGSYFSLKGKTRFFLKFTVTGPSTSNGTAEAKLRINSLTNTHIGGYTQNLYGGGATCSHYGSILHIVKNKKNKWDVYVGGQKYWTDVLDITSIYFNLTSTGGCWAVLYIYDVRWL